MKAVGLSLVIMRYVSLGSIHYDLDATLQFGCAAANWAFRVSDFALIISKR